MKLYDVVHESGGLTFEIAFAVPLDQADAISERVRLAFAEKESRLDDGQPRPWPQIAARAMRRRPRLVPGAGKP